VDADQSRMARAAIDISLTQLMERTGVGKNRVSQFEKREAALVPDSHEKVKSYLSRFVVFVSERMGEHGAGVLLRPGMTAGAWRGENQDSDGDLNPVDDGGTQLLEYWRARPTDWAGLPMEARASMLMAIFGRVPEVDPIASECAAE
jgi:transcriptional regulator with XRE-family HTH domain